MLLHLVCFVSKKEFFPQLLVERFHPEYSIDQFDRFTQKYPESFSQLQKDCQKNGNESCLKLGIKMFYQTKNVTNPRSFAKVIPVFEKCAKQGNSHCADFLTQIYYFHSANSDYTRAIAQNKFSNSVFGRLFRGMLRANGKLLPKSYLSAIDEVSSIAKATFIMFLTEDFHCMKVPCVIDENLNALESAISAVKQFDRFLLGEKYPRNFPPDFYCHLQYEEVRELFNDFLNNEKSKYLIGRSVFKLLMSDVTRNSTFYSNLVHECFQTESDSTMLHLAIVQLYMLLNGSKRDDAAQKLKFLAKKGDSFLGANLAFGYLLEMEPFADDISIFPFTKAYSPSPYYSLISAILFETKLDQSQGAEDAFKNFMISIHSSPLVSEASNAQEALEGGNYDLAMLIYERLALMGNKESLHNLKMIMKYLKADTITVDVLEQAFGIGTTEFYSQGVIYKFLDPDYQKISIAHPFLAFRYAFNSPDIYTARMYLRDLNNKIPWTRYFTPLFLFIVDSYAFFGHILLKILPSNRILYNFIIFLGILFFSYQVLQFFIYFIECQRETKFMQKLQLMKKGIDFKE